MVICVCMQSWSQNLVLISRKCENNTPVIICSSLCQYALIAMIVSVFPQQHHPIKQVYENRTT